MHDSSQALPAPAHRCAFALLATCVVLLSAAAGCKRGFYRHSADAQTYSIIGEKGAGPTWSLKPGFSIDPDQRSRFYDPTNPIDPTLPIPAPQLYNYELPPLATPKPAPRDLTRNASQDGYGDAPGSETDMGQEPDGELIPPGELVPSSGSDGSTWRLQEAGDTFEVTQQQTDSQSQTSAVTQQAPVQQVSWRNELALADANRAAADSDVSDLRLLESFGQNTVISIQPIPVDAWNALPEKCLRRMLEFESVRVEYFRTFEEEVTEAQLDPSERLNLENILELALINDRDYQARKELLYRTALRLSLERFDYDLRFFARGNGTDVNYRHNRVGGVEVNTLGIPTTIGVQKSLYTAGNLVARFANDVVLTFNGTSGYSSSIGSEMLFELTQPLIQRDVQFEPLTQAERDVVYAARDFVRFRKQLFRDLSVQYYSLLLTYRGIEINTQDYFSNLGGFNRAAAFEQVGQLPLFQVDQFEQNALRSRGNLINSCNSLERAIDAIKFQVGLPPELPLNIDLSELEELSLRDEATVIREQLRRKTNSVLQQSERFGISVAVPAAAELARRMVNLSRVNQRLGAIGEEKVRELEILVARLEAEDKRIEATENAQVLEDASSKASEVLPAQIYLRNSEVIELTLESIQRALALLRLVSEESLAAATSTDPGDVDPAVLKLINQWALKVEEYEALSDRLRAMPNVERSEKLPNLIAEAEQLLVETRQLEQTIATRLAQQGMALAADEQDLLELIDFTVSLTSDYDFGSSTGLAELEVDVDQAMLTALVQRLDLMNQRGDLADAWRQIKYAGDDLRSILNLRASQSIRTRAGSDNPFDFSFDDSTTSLGLNFDTPLNRRAERNIFRLALINYNVALRNLIDAQDGVKLDIRNDIRAIELDRNQYEISIASAALAYERVTSTRLQLATGQGNVSARDVLEAQQAYTQSLSGVAQQHIGYIIDRIEFFLNLEQLEVNQLNYWPELRNESYPFVADTDFGRAMPDGYGRLPSGPWYSDCLRRMERVPAGTSFINKPLLD